MKKHSVATKGAAPGDTRSDVLVVESQRDLKPAATEAVLLSALEKFFDVVLNYPAINRYVSHSHMHEWFAFSVLFSMPFQCFCL
jgi:hypothetical protein